MDEEQKTNHDAERLRRYLEYKAKGLDSAVWFIRVPPGLQYQTDDWSMFLFRTGSNYPDKWYTWDEHCDIRDVLGGDRAVLYLPEQRPET